MGQVVRVLVVDDSAFFRHRITEVLQQSPDIKVVGTAIHGKEAIEKTSTLKPDVITMDVEMPVMNGIEAVREIMSQCPTPILMFSNLTSDGAKVTLDALDAGAVDFLSKNFTPTNEYDDAYVLLREKIYTIARKTNLRTLKKTTSVTGPAGSKSAELPKSRKGDYELLAIGASTGGPVALQNVLTKLPANFPLPIVVMVHMPSTFTPAYAKRLNDLCRIEVKEAVNNDRLQAGKALIAPGGKQLLVEKNHAGGYVLIKDSLPEQTYKPSVDVGFGSAALSYKNKVLALVLTGMGADGKMGAQKLKQSGSTVWSQDEDSCVVYGMPQAVEKAGLSDRVMPINEIGQALNKAV